MDNISSFLLVLGLFVVRLGIPIVITLGVGYWLRRLDQRWQAEAMSRQATALARESIESQPQLQMFGVGSEQQPCWLFKNCDKQARDQCPAYINSQLPCWMARYRANGFLPARCYRCALFLPRRRQTGLPVAH